jgi:nicotinamide-nucleotide amidase
MYNHRGFMTLKQEILRYSRQENIGPLTNWFESSLDQLIDEQVYADLNQLEDTGKKLISGLISYGKKYNIHNAVVGMSGGVDSALTAALFKAAGWSVTGVTMPIHQKKEETDRGIEACKSLRLEHMHVDLTDQFENLLASVRDYDIKIDEPQNSIRRGNLRVRSRMITLYNIASMTRGLVGSTDNFSELAAGFWTLHGDVGDLAPIQSLNKSWEVPKLAEIYGVPASTVFATPTDGLGISNGDEDQFGFSYLEFDIVLMKLCQLEKTFSRTELLEYLAVPQQDFEKINKILDRIKMSSFKRRNPYNLEHPHQKNRYIGLNNLDESVWKL